MNRLILTPTFPIETIQVLIQTFHYLCTSQNSLPKVGPSHPITNTENDTSNGLFEVNSSDDENVNIPENNDDQWF